MIPRKELLKKLATVDGALAPATSQIPMNTHFWFTGRNLMTFNGRMSIMVPCVTDFKGAVPRKLVSLLKTSTAEEIDLIPVHDDTLEVRAGKSKVKLPMLAPNFTFKMPPSETMDTGKPLLVDAGRFVQSVEACLQSCGTMTHTIDMLGVTLQQIDSGWLDLFSTDAETISFATVRYDGGLLTNKFKRIVIPTEWCKEFVKLAAGQPELYLDVTDDYVMLDGPSGVLYCTVLEPDKNPLPFRDTLNAAYSLAAENSTVKIPEDIVPLLERANIIVMKAKMQPVVLMEVENSELIVIAKSENGEVREHIHFGKGHPHIRVPVNVKRVLDGAKLYDRMVITEAAVIMLRDKTGYLVAPLDGAY